MTAKYFIKSWHRRKFWKKNSDQSSQMWIIFNKIWVATVAAMSKSFSHKVRPASDANAQGDMKRAVLDLEFQVCLSFFNRKSSKTPMTLNFPRNSTKKMKNCGSFSRSSKKKTPAFATTSILSWSCSNRSTSVHPSSWESWKKKRKNFAWKKIVKAAVPSESSLRLVSSFFWCSATSWKFFECMRNENKWFQMFLKNNITSCLLGAGCVYLSKFIAASVRSRTKAQKLRVEAFDLITSLLSAT